MGFTVNRGSSSEVKYPTAEQVSIDEGHLVIWNDDSDRIGIFSPGNWTMVDQDPEKS